MRYYKDIRDFASLMQNPSNVPRRDAYLFTWGIGYAILGFYWLLTGFYSGIPFIMVGFVSLFGSMIKSQSLKATSFALLAGAAVLHAFNFLWAFPFVSLSLPRQMLIMWVVVAMSHVIVAGWPAHCLDHIHLTNSGERHDKKV